MKVVHSLGFYFPDTSGGTEVYVEGLTHELKTRGVENLIAAPKDGTQEFFYQHNHVPVYRYPVFLERNREQLRGDIHHGGFDFFQNWLKSQNAEIYHQHSWTLGCGEQHLNYAKSLGLKTVLTFHVPNFLCLRGTLSLNGAKPCDGILNTHRCATCWGQSTGIPLGIAFLLAKTPLRISRYFHQENFLNFRFATALARRSLVMRHQSKFNEIINRIDRVVVIAKWFYQMLINNGVSENKIVWCPQGLSNIESNLINDQKKHETLEVGFLGRWDPHKGIQLLINAVRQLSIDTPIHLTIYGMIQGKDSKIYKEQVVRSIKRDVRISVCEPLKRSEIGNALRKLDVLAVPSTWFEMAPLVVLEAHAAGVPVVGVNYGGIGEYIQHGVNGWLIEKSNEENWKKIFTFLVENRPLVQSMKNKLWKVRSMKDVSEEMYKMYQDLLI